MVEVTEQTMSALSLTVGRPRRESRCQSPHRVFQHCLHNKCLQGLLWLMVAWASHHHSRDRSAPLTVMEADAVVAEVPSSPVGCLTYRRPWNSNELKKLYMNEPTNHTVAQNYYIRAVYARARPVSTGAFSTSTTASTLPQRPSRL